MKLVKQVNMIDVSDWDALVEKTYGRTYNFQQQDGCKDRGIFKLRVPESPEEAAEYDFENDTIPEKVNGEEMGVSFKAWLERDPKNMLKAGYGYDRSSSGREIFWERNFYPAIETVAYDLYKKGLLQSGEYLINIDW